MFQRGALVCSVMRSWRFPDFYLSHIYQSDFCQATFTHHTFTHQDFYLSLVLALKKTFTHQDIHSSGHSPIFFYFKHHKQRSIRRKLNPSLSLNKKLFSHRHLPWTMLGTYCQTYVVFHSHALSEGLHKAMIIWRFQDPKPQFEAMQLFKVSLMYV